MQSENDLDKQRLISEATVLNEAYKKLKGEKISEYEDHIWNLQDKLQRVMEDKESAEDDKMDLVDEVTLLENVIKQNVLEQQRLIRKATVTNEANKKLKEENIGAKQEVQLLDLRIKILEEKNRDLLMKNSNATDLPTLNNDEKTMIEFQPTKLKIDSEHGSRDSEWKIAYEEKYEKLYQTMRQKIQENRKLEDENAKLRQQMQKMHMKASLQADTTTSVVSSGGRSKFIQTLTLEKRELKRKTQQLEDENVKLKQQMQMHENKNTHVESLKKNWLTKLAQMETAIITIRNVHKRDRLQFDSKLNDKDLELSRLKLLLARCVSRKHRQHQPSSGVATTQENLASE